MAVYCFYFDCKEEEVTQLERLLKERGIAYMDATGSEPLCAFPTLEDIEIHLEGK